MKTLDDALALRGRIFGAFELAEAEPDDEKRRALMTFVVVGGGPTGVEMAGQLRELSGRALHRNYRRIDTHKTRVVLVEGGDGLVRPWAPGCPGSRRVTSSAWASSSTSGRWSPTWTSSAW